jgi:LmbE family N-acetylglucosaminyl deacetylase
VSTPEPRAASGPLVVLSPHFDDAVFSCGGTIAAATAEGRPALVVTFFAREPDLAAVPPRLRGFARYDVRRAEDLKALRILGASHEWLDYVERAFRPPPLRHPLSVFRGAPRAGTATPANAERMQEAIAERLDRHPGSTVLAPLAVGNHCDHVEVFLAAMLVMVRLGRFDRFRFYEDAYALGTAVRRRHFVTRRVVWKPREAPDRTSFRAWALGRVVGLARRGPPLEESLPPEARALDWRCEPAPFGDREEARKLQALAAYASQLELLGGAQTWFEALRRYHAFWGLAEPLWRAGPAAARASPRSA